MLEDLYNDPQLQDYLVHAEREMIPKMESSAIAVTLITSKVDAKICLELGAAILLDKPIIVVMLQGAKVPANLRRIASVIIEGDLRDKETRDKLQAAMSSVIANDRRLH